MFDTVEDDTLQITQTSGLVEVKTAFTAYADTNALRIQTTVKNIA